MPVAKQDPWIEPTQFHTEVEIDAKIDAWIDPGMWEPSDHIESDEDL